MVEYIYKHAVVATAKRARTSRVVKQLIVPNSSLNEIPNYMHIEISTDKSICLLLFSSNGAQIEAFAIFLIRQPSPLRQSMQYFVHWVLLVTVWY